MNNKYKTYLILAVTIIGFSLYFFLRSDQQVGVGEAQQLTAAKKVPVEIEKTDKDKSDKGELRKADGQNKFDLAGHYGFEMFSYCGFDIKRHQEQMKILDLESFNAEQLERLDEFVDSCNAWFERLNSLDDKSLEEIKQKLLAKKKLLTSLAIYEYKDEAINQAIANIKHSDADISATALLYLLSFDYDFLNKIGEAIGTNDTRFLQSNVNFSTLFLCQRRAHLCAADSSLMEDLCFLDKKACNLSYEAFFRETVNIDQYNNYLNALQVINSIIESDWFEQRELAVDSTSSS